MKQFVDRINTIYEQTIDSSDKIESYIKLFKIKLWQKVLGRFRYLELIQPKPNKLVLVNKKASIALKKVGISDVENELRHKIVIDIYMKNNIPYAQVYLADKKAKTKEEAFTHLKQYDLADEAVSIDSIIGNIKPLFRELKPIDTEFLAGKIKDVEVESLNPVLGLSDRAGRQRRGKTVKYHLNKLVNKEE